MNDAPSLRESPSPRFPATAVAIAHLMIAWDGWRASRRKWRALRLLAKATKLSPETVAQIGVAAVSGAGFTISKDGQEYAVLVGGKPLPAAEEPER